MFAETDAGVPSELEMSASLILRRVKLHSTKPAVIPDLTTDTIHCAPWNPARRLLYTAGRGDHAVL